MAMHNDINEGGRYPIQLGTPMHVIHFANSNRNVTKVQTSANREPIQKTTDVIANFVKMIALSKCSKAFRIILRVSSSMKRILGSI